MVGANLGAIGEGDMRAAAPGAERAQQPKEVLSRPRRRLGALLLLHPHLDARPVVSNVAREHRLPRPALVSALEALEPHARPRNCVVQHALRRRVDRGESSPYLRLPYVHVVRVEQGVEPVTARVALVDHVTPRVAVGLRRLERRAALARVLVLPRAAPEERLLRWRRHVP